MNAARIVTVFNEKGGAGKTTLACNLANTLGLRSYKVQLLDLDGQRAARQWATAGKRKDKEPDDDATAKALHAERRLFNASVWAGDLHSGEQLHDEVASFRDDYDVIIADCAPSVENERTWAMLLVSDLILIPTKLSKIDMDALAQAKLLAKKAQRHNECPVRVVGMAVRAHINDDQHYLKSLEKDKDFPLLGETLGFRQAYPRSRVVGSSVHKVSAPEAVREVEALADRVLKLIDLPLKKLQPMRKAA